MEWQIFLGIYLALKANQAGFFAQACLTNNTICENTEKEKQIEQHPKHSSISHKGISRDS